MSIKNTKPSKTVSLPAKKVVPATPSPKSDVEEKETVAFVKLTPAERRALPKEELRAYFKRYNAYRRENGLIKPKAHVDQVKRAFERLNTAHKVVSRLVALFSADSENELERSLATEVHAAHVALNRARTDVNDLPSGWRSKTAKVHIARDIVVGATVQLKPKQAEQYAPIFGSASTLLEVRKISGKFAILKPTTGEGPQLAIEMHKLQFVSGPSAE